MKKYGNGLAIGIILLLLILGYGIPSVVMAFEDSQLKREVKSIEIEDIELNFHNVDVQKELAVFSDMLLNNIIVEKDETRIMMVEETSDEKYQEMKQSIQEFLQLVNPNEEVEFEKISVTYSVMMVSKEEEDVYPVWKCDVVDKEDREYCFWIDDLSGKVMAFDIPYDLVGVKDEDFINAMEHIAEYYEYSIFGLAEEVTNMYKSEGWQNGLILLDVEGNIDVCLNVFKLNHRLMFNIYPGTLSVSEQYDAE